MKNPGNIGYYSPLYHDPPTYPDLSASSKGRVFLVAIQGEHPALGRGKFDRVHVMVINPNEMADFSDPLSVLCALPEVSVGPPPAPPTRGLIPVHSRPVRGEILRNQEGELYERWGQTLVPLRNLVAGPRGEVIEFASPPSRNAQGTTWAGTLEEDRPIEWEYSETFDGEADTELSSAGITYADTRPASRKTICRNLFADPGQLRLVSFGDFPALLAPQLSHPDRLRDSHRLPCYVQVFEITRSQPSETLASVIGDPSSADQLHFLSDSAAHRLGLTELLHRRPRRPRLLMREPGLLLPGDLVCRLRVVRDPTSDLNNHEARPPKDREEFQPADSGKTAEAPSAVAKKSVPERYLKPWEFQMSREEVLYTMNANALMGGWFRSFLRWLGAWRGRDEFHRWKSLVAGKSPEDQLWTVRPPKWGLAHPAIRGWVSKTLALAGYEPQGMLEEWEIFWRRKGL